jgi:hypothetical protein
MSDIKDNARQALVEGLKVVTGCKVNKIELQAGDVKKFSATTQSLITNTKVFMGSSEKVFKECEDIVYKDKAEIDSKEFKQFEVGLKELHQDCQQAVSNIKNSKHSNIFDDITNSFIKLQTVIQESIRFSKPTYSKF